ncbi:hypothetical protein F8E02_10615 [Methanoculleus sp. Wushi-C6]|uniref:Putative zinc ribbon domain-containing protein n=1 Tax=Methanoculleus caldifontis TaxID=2651577 RepID=A0ABU3X311_9EURY|nr:zinc ribbon domain-containing protein [Methanoculleus sp. Wushi-C6]MDV2482443.1 hypothetical protein [Methanoculleus sp. Wushi-C6]
MERGNIRTCQSCGMPMSTREHFGTEADGSPSKDYCTYCYQNGAFTAPDITLEAMAKIGGGMMSQMYAIPIEKAESFTKEHLACLKRWAGREIPVCESCGMPLARDDDAGSEADGSPSEAYCAYCYRDGAFTEPDLTREQAVVKYAPMMAENLGMPLDKAQEMVGYYLSTLPRWR